MLRGLGNRGRAIRFGLHLSRLKLHLKRNRSYHSFERRPSALLSKSSEAQSPDHHPAQIKHGRAAVVARSHAHPGRSSLCATKHIQPPSQYLGLRLAAHGPRRARRFVSEAALKRSAFLRGSLGKERRIGTPGTEGRGHREQLGMRRERQTCTRHGFYMA